MMNILVPCQSAPWFQAQVLGSEKPFTFDRAAGRWTIMLFLGSGQGEKAQKALEYVEQNRNLFDDKIACFFGVTVDTTDAATDKIATSIPGVRWFLDYDGDVSTLYGAAERRTDGFNYTPHWLILDPMQRVRSIVPLEEGETVMARFREFLSQPQQPAMAPVLIVPEVLPERLCRELISVYEREGGRDSGFMEEENGITVEKWNYQQKRRRDFLIFDADLIREIKYRLVTSLSPMIERSFQFHPTRIERFLVACYDSEENGHFARHRDNTTKGTAHRKFACTINLNAGEFEGGGLRFPEFGNQTYTAPTGSAIIFSCSLLHQARPVTRGKRYAFLPFFYDDEGARLREDNITHVTGRLKEYRSGLAGGD